MTYEIRDIIAHRPDPFMPDEKEETHYLCELYDPDRDERTQDWVHGPDMRPEDRNMIEEYYDYSDERPMPEVHESETNHVDILDRDPTWTEPTIVKLKNPKRPPNGWSRGKTGQEKEPLDHAWADEVEEYEDSYRLVSDGVEWHLSKKVVQDVRPPGHPANPY